MMRRLIAGVLLAGALFAAHGCGGGGSSSSSDAPDPAVLFYNGVSDSLPYDFLLNDSTEASNIAYRESSANFVSTEPRVTQVLARHTGTTNEIWAQDYDLQRDRDYVISMLGIENFGTEFQKRARLFRTEVDRKVPNGSTARIVVVHGFARSAGLDTPNIDFQNPGNNPQVRLTNIAFGASQSRLIDATSQTFQARRNGTEFVFAERTFTFEAGKVYMVYVVGVEGAAAPNDVRIEIVEIETE
jgi:hypothetical protein